MSEVLSTWEQQFRRYLTIFPVGLFDMSNYSRHLRDNTVSLGRYHGQKRGSVDLSAFDIILTTFQIVASEWKPGGGSTSSIFSRSWHRIVLDEGNQFTS